jgi:hypothetical protein
MTELTERERQQLQRASIKAAVQMAVDQFMDKIGGMDLHAIDIATVTIRILPKSTALLAERIQQRRAWHEAKRRRESGEGGPIITPGPHG